MRHPTPTGHEGICYGRSDVPLGPSAPAEIERIIALLSPLGIATVWSSPRARALAPARSIADMLGCPAPRIDERLAELDFGAWEGRPWAAIERREIDEWAEDVISLAPPDGETGAALIARVTAAFDDIIRADEPACVITHGGPLKILAALAAGVAIDLAAPAPGFASVSIIPA